ncbi:hypothetical protein FQN54_002629 [Arachnomyces sp. PD_36]|nr:hypothetical protein FQN54_002629 [Arachnomyces sp. PD_36]
MPSDKTTTGGSAELPICRFNEEPCPTQSVYHRKVVSHIFGRNKKCTRALPDGIWTYYCRKHYQRAKYRMNGWGVHQSELAIRAVENMDAWGGVESFNLQLRRREADRANKLDNDAPTSAADAESAANTAASEASMSMSPEPDSAVDINDLSSASPTSLSASSPAGTKKKSPRIVPCPAPKWLRDIAGNHKTFDEIIQILDTLRVELAPLTDEPDTVPDFPDIEILPNIKPEYMDAVEKTPRVNKKGGVKKT